MATPIQQRLLDLANDIATSPPEDLAFTHSVLAQTSLPTAKPPEGMLRWERRQGRATLLVVAGEALDPKTQQFAQLPLPYGPKARLLLMHLNSEAVRRQSPIIPVEDSMTAFFRRVMGRTQDGRHVGRLKAQLASLAAATFRLGIMPNFPTVTHPTAGMPQKTAGFYGRSRFVVLKITVLPRTFGIDRLDADVLASVFEECSSHSWSSKIKAGPSIFARRTSVRASTTLARVVPKSVCAPQCFDFKSYFFVWWESWVMQGDDRALQLDTKVVSAFDLWYPKNETQRVLWPSMLRLSLDYYESLTRFAVPLDERAIAALAHSATALDIYCWLAQRLHRIPAGQPQFIPWTAIYDQFGQGYREVRKFRRDFLKLLVQVKAAYPAAKLSNDGRGLILEASQPPVLKRVVQVGGLSPETMPQLEER